MLYRKSYHSPLGELTMVSNGKALTALSFQGEKYNAALSAEEARTDRKTAAVEEVRTDRKAAAVKEAKRLDRIVVDVEEFLMDSQAAVIEKAKMNDQAAGASEKKGAYGTEEGKCGTEKREKCGVDSTETSGAEAVFERTKKWLDSYFSGHNPDFIPPICLKGTSFQEDVWEILNRIPYGKVISYGEIARQIAEKRGLKRMSAQAVGGAVGRNPIAIIVPCHRVIGSNGSFTGYAGGLDKKTELLKIEGVLT